MPYQEKQLRLPEIDDFVRQWNEFMKAMKFAMAQAHLYIRFTGIHTAFLDERLLDDDFPERAVSDEELVKWKVRYFEMTERFEDVLRQAEAETRSLSNKKRQKKLNRIAEIREGLEEHKDGGIYFFSENFARFDADPPAYKIINLDSDSDTDADEDEEPPAEAVVKREQIEAEEAAAEAARRRERLLAQQEADRRQRTDIRRDVVSETRDLLSRNFVDENILSISAPPRDDSSDRFFQTTAYHAIPELPDRSNDAGVDWSDLAVAVLQQEYGDGTSVELINLATHTATKNFLGDSDSKSTAYLREVEAISGRPPRFISAAIAPYSARLFVSLFEEDDSGSRHVTVISVSLLAAGRFEDLNRDAESGELLPLLAPAVDFGEPARVWAKWPISNRPVPGVGLLCISNRGTNKENCFVLLEQEDSRTALKLARIAVGGQRPFSETLNRKKTYRTIRSKRPVALPLIEDWHRDIEGVKSSSIYGLSASPTIRASQNVIVAMVARYAGDGRVANEGRDDDVIYLYAKEGDMFVNHPLDEIPEITAVDHYTMDSLGYDVCIAFVAFQDDDTEHLAAFPMGLRSLKKDHCVFISDALSLIEETYVARMQAAARDAISLRYVHKKDSQLHVCLDWDYEPLKETIHLVLVYRLPQAWLDFENAE